MSTPWERDPRLTRERLVKIAELLRAGRDDAVARFDVSVGCNGWTLGCDAFAFGCARILWAAGAKGYEWLSVLDPSMHLVFTIDGIPARFYRGPPDDPTARTLRVSYSELRQGLLDFGGTEPEAELLCRFAVETSETGEVERISFVGLRGEQPVLVWEIPLAAPVADVVPLRAAADTGVDLPAPIVRRPAANTDRAANDDSAQS